MPKIYSAYDTPKVDGVLFEQPSRAKGSFLKECDINNIVPKNYNLSFGYVCTAGMSFGDFSIVDDYHSAVNAVMDAQASFEALPAVVRRRFDNDPAALLSFLADDANREEAVKLGLVNPSFSPSSTPSASSEAAKTSDTAL